MGASRTGDRRLPWACSDCGREYQLDIVAKHCSCQGGDGVAHKRKGHGHPGSCCSFGVVLDGLNERNLAHLESLMPRRSGRSDSQIAGALRSLGFEIGYQSIGRHRSENVRCECCRHEAAMRGAAPESDDLGFEAQ